MSIPVIIVAGYLGAGKTTMINAFLQAPDGIRATVLVNDFGAINLDARLIENSSGQTIALTNGCACCAIGDDLLSAAEQAAEAQPDLMVIEASGVAEPRRMSMLLRGVGALRPATVLTVVNGRAAQRNATDKFVRNLFRSQIASADYLSLNRAQVRDDFLSGYLGQHAADTAQIKAINEISAKQHCPQGLGHDRSGDHSAVFKHAVLQPRGDIGISELKTLLLKQAGGIERAKGMVMTSDGLCWVEFVQGEFTAAPAGHSSDNIPLGLVVISTQSTALEALQSALS